jgi:hypothetical protein
MKSAADIYRKALTLVGAVGAGQTPSAEDISICEASFVPMIAEMAANNDAYIVVNSNRETRDLDDELFTPLAKMLAHEIAPDFGASSDEGMRSLMLARIRQLKLQRDRITVTFDASTDLVTWAYHAMTTGQTIRLFNSAGALPVNLVEDEPYYIIKVSRDTFRLADSYGQAILNEAIDFTTNGTGTTTATKTFESVEMAYI